MLELLFAHSGSGEALSNGDGFGDGFGDGDGLGDGDGDSDGLSYGDSGGLSDRDRASASTIDGSAYDLLVASITSRSGAGGAGQREPPADPWWVVHHLALQGDLRRLPAGLWSAQQASVGARAVALDLAREQRLRTLAEVLGGA